LTFYLFHCYVSVMAQNSFIWEQMTALLQETFGKLVESRLIVLSNECSK